MTNELVENDGTMDARIYTIRGERVMLDSDLAEIYQVLTKQLNQAVKRNERRFPAAFSFQLSQDEWNALRSQIVTLKTGRGQHRKYPPRVFTESGAVALAMVLDSDRAVDASILVVQAFIRMRHILSANAALARRIDEVAARLEKKSAEDHVKFTAIFQELKRLALGFDAEDAKPKGRIGYRSAKEREQGGKAKSRKNNN